MDTSWLLWLRCPFCGGSLSLSGIDQATHAPGYDILSCWCSRYPMVAGIPVLKRTPNGTLNELIALIERGQYREALMAMISPPSPTLAPAWLQALPSARGIHRLRRLAHQRALRRWEEQAAALLTNQEGRVTAYKLFDFYFRRYPENRNYFYFRFGQPRHLGALSFTSLIQQPKNPILDLACGCGHITRTLTQRAGGQLVIGMDESFFGLYVAKHWIAPEAQYVCCTADIALPFADDIFSVSFCSDAFHYFINKAAIFRELERLTLHDGLIMLVWLHNGRVRLPHRGLPLPSEGYQELMADLPHCLVAAGDVLARYRQKQGPSLIRSRDIKCLSHAPLLSLIASHRQEVFQDHGSFVDWPHAEGHLGLNPLYAMEEHDDLGTVCLRRQFPSVFYEEEHRQCKDYLPETVRIPASTWTNLVQGIRTGEIEELIDQCIVLGLPERYGPDAFPTRRQVAGMSSVTT
jgi:SAM-dependent methyltransferase